jgi:hypothetical protein
MDTPPHGQHNKAGADEQESSKDGEEVQCQAVVLTFSASSCPSADIQSQVDKENTCKFCNSGPCLLEQGVYEELTLAYELSVDPADLSSSLLSNKEIRFRLYRYTVNWIHEYLGKGNRRKLPQCVESEIRHAPESTGIYVGFKKRKCYD